MSVNNVVSMSAAIARRNECISYKVSKLANIHCEINNLELNLIKLHEDFKTAFQVRSYPEMLSISRNIYDFSMKLDGYKKLEQLVLQDKTI